MTRHSFDTSFETLTDEQKQAVLHREGPALVIAGAGSGKTKVVTLRVAHLISHGMDPSSLVAVTFTNKAAQEMRDRIEAIAGRQVLVSTFHSLGARILREFITHLGYSADFSIYDADESERALKAVLRTVYDVSLDDDVATYKAALSKRKNSIGPKSMVECDDERFEKLFIAYQESLKRSGAVDFDDLLYLPLQLFTHHPEVLAKLQERWTYVLVDEYQDANDCQSHFIEHLAGQRKNVFAVGDPDQSIYSWRGANIRHIMKFQEKFPSARLFRLQQNFRSTSTILSASNAVIQQNSDRIDKSLWSQNGDGEKISCFVARTEREEASFVGDSLESMLEAGYTGDQMAVLYRTNSQSRSIEDALLLRGIPYKIIGGLSFYERREVRDILSYLKLLVHPHDSVAFERVVTRPKRGLGTVTLEKVIEYCRTSDCSFIEFLRKVASNECTIVTEKQRKGFLSLYEGLRAAGEAVAEGRLFAALSNIIQDSGYLAFLETEAETFIERKENLEQLLVKSKEWEEAHPGAPITLFLEEMVLDPAKEHVHEFHDKVPLMTAHNAKGLEFDHVFIIGLEEDLFPHIHSKKGDGDVEEERRLFYVAMTRAKKHLTVSCAQVRCTWGAVRNMRPSRFLKEIPLQFLQPLRKPKVFSKEALASPLVEMSVGSLVFHPQFGPGRIEAMTSSSSGEMLKIFFSQDKSTKTLVKEFAPLKLIGTRSV